LIALLFVTFTLATCTPNSSKIVSSELETPEEVSQVPVPSASTSYNNADSTLSQKREDCPVRILLSENPALTCAKVYGFEKGEILIAGESKDKEALLFHKERLQAKTSRAELIFDTLDMAKAEINSDFDFEEGLRASQLKNLGLRPEYGKFNLDLGKIAISDIVFGTQSGNSSVETSGLGVNTDPSSSQNTASTQSDSTNIKAAVLGVSTKEMDIASNGAVYVVQRDERQQKTQVFNLAKESIKVADNRKAVRLLGQYQTISASKDGFIGEPFEFGLCSFYRDNEELLEGLRPGEEEIVKAKPKVVQLAYDATRSRTLPVYHERCQRRCPIRSVY